MDPTDPRIDRALATLTATTLGADWVEPSELRHRARSRRSLRRGVVVGVGVAGERMGRGRIGD